MFLWDILSLPTLIIKLPHCPFQKGIVAFQSIISQIGTNPQVYFSVFFGRIVFTNLVYHLPFKIKTTKQNKTNNLFSFWTVLLSHNEHSFILFNKEGKEL